MRTCVCCSDPITKQCLVLHWGPRRSRSAIYGFTGRKPFLNRLCRLFAVTEEENIEDEGKRLENIFVELAFSFSFFGLRLERGRLVFPASLRQKPEGHSLTPFSVM